MRQVERIALEVPNPRCVTLTEGAPSCEQIVQALRQMGFVTEDQASILPPGYEAPAGGLKRGFGCEQLPAFAGAWGRSVGAGPLDTLRRRRSGQHRRP